MTKVCDYRFRNLNVRDYRFRSLRVRDYRFWRVKLGDDTDSFCAKFKFLIIFKI